MKLDLHIHTERSLDSRAALEQIAERARERGLSAIAICDHNRFYDGPLPEGILLLRGCEFSTEYGHLLGLGMDRAVEAETFEELIQGIHEAGGIAVLAHPYEHLKYAEKIEEIAHLLDGVEILNARACRKNQKANEQALDFARRHKLAIFAGSDAHDPQEVGRCYIEIEELSRWREGGFCARGQQSPSRATAKCQKIKLQKSGAPLWKYLRWFAFWCKCFLEDIIRKQERKSVTYRKDW